MASPGRISATLLESCLTKSDGIIFGRLHTWTLTFHYDKAADVLSIKAPWRDTGTWVDLLDEVRVMVDSGTGDAVAFLIKDFKSEFLANRPDLLPLWEQIKPNPIALKRMEATPFIGAFLEHMEQLAYDRDEQLDPRARAR